METEISQTFHVTVPRKILTANSVTEFFSEQCTYNLRKFIFCVYMYTEKENIFYIM